MDRTLQPEDRIAHYRVVGPLAAGGMGEVYIAQDQTLERSVALKVLPSRLVRNDERVRRFVTEAKSASSLSHPHIVTIYEIGQDRVRSGEDGEADPDSEPVHYISMELVTGETLKNKIHHEKTDLRTLLGYLVQAAEGLAKAHASGIVHRDLKPSNIMISRDGYAKVLDFGLAKLTEREATSADMTSAATEVADATGEGVVLGTVGYMSPEQVRGKAVDHRADIFSFGCILYEAATRRRPFAADSDVETMHEILNQQPDAVEEIAPETPNALRRLIRRCLAKNPDQRLQSMKDLAIELREIVDEFDTLTPSGSASSITPPPAVAVRRGPSPATLGVAAVAVLAVAVSIWALTRGEAPPAPPAAPEALADLTMTSLVSAEQLDDPVISPDGRYLAYVSGPTGERSLWVRQVATGSQIRAAGPERFLDRVSFGPDGNYVFFSMRDPETPNYRVIFSVPSLGGTPRKRIFDVDGPLSFSPDGARACFRRGVPQESRTDIVVVDLESREERLLTSSPDAPGLGDPAWSPDGRTIAVNEFQFTGGAHSEILLLDETTGDERDRVVLPPGFFVTSLTWLPDGGTLVASATDSRSSGGSQLWLISVPDGGRRRLTNDLNSYVSVSIGEDGRAIAALRGTQLANVWMVAADGSGGPRQVTHGGGGSERISVLLPLPSGEVVFQVQSAGSADLAVMAPDGSRRRTITSGQELYFRPIVAGEVLVTGRASSDFVPHVWKMSADGSGARQLTDGDGELPLGLSPDGKRLLFTKARNPVDLWTLPVEGGEPRLLMRDVGDFGDTDVDYSPDGKWITFNRLRERDGRWRPTSVIASAETGETLVELPRPPVATDVEWTPDSRGLTFLGGDGQPRNVYRMTRDAPEPVAVTRFPDGIAFGHEWSPDGARILVARRVGSTVGYWVVPADGEPFPIATFPTGGIYEGCWMADGSTVLFRYGTESEDVVLLRGFR